MISNLNLKTENLHEKQFLPKVQPMDLIYELSLFNANLNYFPSHHLQLSLKAPSSEIQAENKPETIKSLLNSQILKLKPEFKLVLANPIEFPIFKGKYFSFKVYLKQVSGIVYPLSETIEIEVLLFNQDEVQVWKNMRGQDILKGNCIQKMNYCKSENKHIANFKVQITEVSSHFIGKVFSLKVIARKSEFLIATGWRVKPICVEHLSVKAKKMCG